MENRVWIRMVEAAQLAAFCTVAIVAASSVSAAWTPAERDTALWLDADDASTITLNGSTVSQWNDKSGNGRNATQATAGSQPTDTAGGLNGKHVLTFDGSSDYFDLGTGLDFLAGVSHSAFIVAKPTIYNNIYGAANGGAGNQSLHVGFRNTSSYRMNYWANDWYAIISANFHAGQGNILNYVWMSGASKEVFANGSSEGNTTGAGIIGTMAGGGRICNVVGQGYFGGDIAEIIICTGTLTLEERQTIEGYLAHKWGLTPYLPAGHPYETSPPGGGELTLDSTDPVDEATGINPATDMVATFSKDIALTGSGSVTITDTTDGTDTRILSLPDSQVTALGRDLTINPTNDLEFGTSYEVSIVSNVVLDASAVTNIYAGTTNGMWNFTTAAADLTAPVITNTVPADDSLDVVPDVNLVATFDDDIVVGSGNIIIYNVTDASNAMVIAVTDVTQVSVSGKVLTIGPAAMLPATKEVAVRIDAGAVKNYSGVDFAGISNNVTWNFTVGIATTTYTGASGSGANDKWNVEGNWDKGVPYGIYNAIIPDQASAFTVAATSGSIPPYSGDLTIGNNVTLQVGWANGSQFPACYNAVGTPGTTTIYMGTNSIVKNRNPRGGANWTVPAVSLYGSATFQNKESTETATNPTFDYPITGGHPLELQYGTCTLNASNSFSALTAAFGAVVNAMTAGALGVGNVAVNDTSKLTIGAADAMADSATLSINGVGGSATVRLTMNGNDAVDQLVVDGFSFPAGTYGATGNGTVDYEIDWISGGSVLTVLNAPVDTNAPALVGIAADAGTGSSFFPLAPVTYTLTFDEPVTSAVTVADFENVGTAPVSMESVTQTDLNMIEVVMTPTSTGTLVLRIAASASFHDLFGNVLSGPITDGSEYMVLERPPDPPIYEPGDYTPGQALAGLNGGTGWGGPWASTVRNGTIESPNNLWGQLATKGHRISSTAWSNLHRPIGTTLHDAGLMANGATLWFSFVVDILNQNLTNLDFNYALTSNTFSTVYGEKYHLLGDSEGIGIGNSTSTRGALCGAYWQDAGAGSALGERTLSVGKLALNNSSNSRALIVGKIEWGADDSAAEALTLYAPGEDLVMPTPFVDAWSTAALNQSQFDRLSMEWKDSEPSIDEIRFGATYEEVTAAGVAPTSAGAVLMIR